MERPPRFSTEHLWPQNRGATEGTPLHSDLHALAPVMQSVNSSRSDHPFGEVPDDDADRWWGPDGATRTAAPPRSPRATSTPRSSTAPTARLEPREAVKGDVARALFYVWTVYGPSGANGLDVAFWSLQRETLLAWHQADPADDAERDRTHTVEAHQGTPNPFVLDATLASRAFGMTAIGSLAAGQVGPGAARVEWTTTAEGVTLSFRIEARLDAAGTPWTTWAETPAIGTPSSYAVTAEGLAPGAYRVRLVAVASIPVVLGEVGVSVGGATAGEQTPEVASSLTPPAPNPAGHGTVRAHLTLTEPAHVLAVVSDALGREVAVVHDAAAVGTVALAVDASGLAPGVYVLRIAMLRAAATGEGGAVLSHRFTVAR